MPKIFTEKLLGRMVAEKPGVASVKGKKTDDPLRQTNKAKTLCKEVKSATVKKGNTARIKTKGAKCDKVCAGGCGARDCSVQGGGIPSGHLGCTDVDRALMALGH